MNLNPGAEPEDMVSVRIFAEARRVISLRLRPLRASDEVLQQLDEGRAEVGLRAVAADGELLTEKVRALVSDPSEVVDPKKRRWKPMNGIRRCKAACNRSAVVLLGYGVFSPHSGNSMRNFRATSGAGSAKGMPTTGTS